MCFGKFLYLPSWEGNESEQINPFLRFVQGSSSHSYKHVLLSPMPRDTMYGYTLQSLARYRLAALFLTPRATFPKQMQLQKTPEPIRCDAHAGSCAQVFLGGNVEKLKSGLKPHKTWHLFYILSGSFESELATFQHGCCSPVSHGHTWLCSCPSCSS